MNTITNAIADKLKTNKTTVVVSGNGIRLFDIRPYHYIATISIHRNKVFVWLRGRPLGVVDIADPDLIDKILKMCDLLRHKRRFI